MLCVCCVYVYTCMCTYLHTNTHAVFSKTSVLGLKLQWLILPDHNSTVLVMGCCFIVI